MIDGYSKDPKGDDIIEVEEKSNSDWALSGPSSSGVVVPRRALHTVRKWAFEDIREILKRRYLLRQVAIELFSSDGRNHLVVFSDVAVRDEVFQKLASIISVKYVCYFLSHNTYATYTYNINVSIYLTLCQ